LRLAQGLACQLAIQAEISDAMPFEDNNTFVLDSMRLAKVVDQNKISNGIGGEVNAYFLSWLHS